MIDAWGGIKETGGMFACDRHRVSGVPILKPSGQSIASYVRVALTARAFAQLCTVVGDHQSLARHRLHPRRYNRQRLASHFKCAVDIGIRVCRADVVALEGRRQHEYPALAHGRAEGGVGRRVVA